MSVAASRSITRPDVHELTSRARDIAQLVRARAQQTELDRRVSEDVVDRMREADLFRILQPGDYGGFEYGFDVFAPIVAVIAGGCGSSGWVYGLLASHQWLTACFPTKAQEEFWRDRGAVAAGTYAPAGQGVAVSGGYKLSGRWSFCSGCDNGQWLYLGGMMHEPAGPKAGFFLVPTEECTIEDNWHTMGLAGTGSKNIIAADVFVPVHRTVSFAELIAGAAPGTHVHANPIYRQSFLAVLPITIVAPVLGMAEAALEHFLSMAKARITRGAVAGGNRAMSDLTTIQMRVAEASALIDAVRLMMIRDLAEAQATVERGEPMSVELRLRNRRNQAFCVRLLVQAIDAVFLASGGQGLFLDSPLQRIWRDAHAAASHISLNWDSAGTMYGQHLLGLEPKGQY
jgi:alkylation response protein AidB-like acyl-CoA dehydrogenase